MSKTTREIIDETLLLRADINEKWYSEKEYAEVIKETRLATLEEVEHLVRRLLLNKQDVINYNKAQDAFDVKN